jgi:hypothetical protein
MAIYRPRYSKMLKEWLIDIYRSAEQSEPSDMVRTGKGFLETFPTEVEARRRMQDLIYADAKKGENSSMSNYAQP